MLQAAGLLQAETVGGRPRCLCTPRRLRTPGWPCTSKLPDLRPAVSVLAVPLCMPCAPKWPYAPTEVASEHAMVASEHAVVVVHAEVVVHAKLAVHAKVVVYRSCHRGSGQHADQWPYAPRWGRTLTAWRCAPEVLQNF